MNRASRTVAIVGLLLLAAVGLYPPVRVVAEVLAEADTGVPVDGWLGQRGPLWANAVHHRIRRLDGSGPYGYPAEIDLGRLLAEALTIVGLSGTLFVLVSRPESR